MDGIADVLVEEGRITQVGVGKFAEEAGDWIIDADGCWVTPGLIDMHVHLREPGFEYKETIRTGTMAAARGGFTTICPMPNTNPVTDSPEMIRNVRSIVEKDAAVHVAFVGAVTEGQEGKKLADLVGMAREGIVGISEDGKSVMNSALYRDAMREAKKLGLLVMAHCEDKDLAGRGALNAGAKAEELGVEGISNAVEDIITARDILLAEETGVKLHICHCSTERSMRMVHSAKESGILVTAEVCPHHFLLSEDDIVERDANFKMNPPLRARKDKDALMEGLRHDWVDVIATDHAPHHADEKAKPIAEAPFGIVGLETAVCLVITECVTRHILSPSKMIEKMSTNPAKILGLEKGTLGVGHMADITIIDPKEEFVVNVNEFASKGTNTPFQGKKVCGRVLFTIVDGNIVYASPSAKKRGFQV
jgi:dihydroorotase